MNTTLPIHQVKDELIDAVKNNNVIIITAETGSGKSTQIPQLLLNELNLSSISTQPRRLACVSLFDRVKQELNNDKIVGYKTAFEEEYSPNENKILFVTDGLLVAAGVKCDYDCIIIDEVHEQSLNIEVLIAWAKLSLKNGSNKKFIFMSATLDIEKLKNFFKDFNPVIVKCPNSPYKVDFIYNNKLKPSVLAVDYASQGKNVMMFLPGKKEIEDMAVSIRNNLPSQDRYVIYQVHGDQTIDEQRPIFENISPKVKIILCTNICQTSITINDIDVAIDTGKAKIAKVKDGMKALALQDISQSDCMQRKGRVGRTKPGIYILNSHTPLNNRSEFPVPEIKRMFLSEVVLRLASYNIDISTLEFLHQPPLHLIDLAKRECIQLGALTKENTLTELGYRIASLPLNVKTAKMLITAEKYNKDVLDAVMKISAIQQVGGLIYHGRNGTFYGKFTKEHNSDLLAELDIYNYIENHKYINFKDEGLNERNYIKAVEYYRKLKGMLWNVSNLIITEGMIREAIRECIIKSVTKDDIFKFNIFDYDNELKKDRSSCVTSNLVIGTPRIIHFEKERYNYSFFNSYDWDNEDDYNDNDEDEDEDEDEDYYDDDYYNDEDDEEINNYYNHYNEDFYKQLEEQKNALPQTYQGKLKLVTNLTKIDENEIKKYFEKDVKEVLEATINIFTDSFDITQHKRHIHTKYMDITFENIPTKIITKNSELYEFAYKSAYNSDKRKLGNNYLEDRKISICGKEFYIHHLWIMNKNTKLKKVFSKLLDMRLKVKKMQFLHSKDKENFLRISSDIPRKMFYVIVLHKSDLKDKQFVEQAKSYKTMYIEDEPLVFIKGNEYSRDLKKFIIKE